MLVFLACSNLKFSLQDLYIGDICVDRYCEAVLDSKFWERYDGSICHLFRYMLMLLRQLLKFDYFRSCKCKIFGVYMKMLAG